MTLVNNNREMKERRRELRNNATKDERLLWIFLKDKGCDGIKFRRQHGVGPYILDFYAPSIRLAVELDGAIHEDLQEQIYDQERDHFLSTVGIKVLRINRHEFAQGIDHVLDLIREAMA